MFKRQQYSTVCQKTSLFIIHHKRKWLAIIILAHYLSTTNMAIPGNNSYRIFTNNERLFTEISNPKLFGAKESLFEDFVDADFSLRDAETPHLLSPSIERR